jgi:putative ATP-dependent endonuclease of the OLD family
MKIKTIEIKNFRSIQEGKLEFDDLTAIIGRNGTGKSSYLHAIEYFYNLNATVNIDDFFNRDISKPIDIRITFSNLKEEEMADFLSFMKKDLLTVTKRYVGEGKNAKYYAASPQIPKFFEIRLIPGKRDRITAWNSLIEEQIFTDLSTRVKNAEDIENLMKDYETKHPDLTEMKEQQVQFIGPPNIGGGQLDTHTKYVLVPAVRKVTDEFSGRNGAIDQLLDMIVLRKIKTRKDLLDFRAEFETRAKKLYCSENLPELPTLGIEISQTLGTYAPGCRLNLNWNDIINVPDIQLPSAKVTLVEDNFEGEIGHKGHGLQRALILTLLQHLAITKPEEPPGDKLSENKKEGEKIGTSQKAPGPDLILALEEPELYLHPSRARYLASVFYSLVELENGATIPTTQVIYATHSPYFVDISHFNQIRILRKQNSDPPHPMQSVVFSYTLDNAISEWITVSKEDPKEIQSRGFVARAMPIMTSLVNEGFFADTVVVVEGLSDLGILWTLQEIMKKDWSQKGIVIVPVSGKNNLDRPTIIFRGFSIPTYLIFDGDIKHKGNPSNEKNTILSNHKYLRLCGATEEDFPETNIGKSWAIFKDNIESDIKESIGEVKFNEIRETIANELGLEPKQVLKNIEGSSLFTKYAYQRGCKFSNLEKIVENVSNLH